MLPVQHRQPSVDGEHVSRKASERVNAPGPPSSGNLADMRSTKMTVTIRATSWDEMRGRRYVVSRCEREPRWTGSTHGRRGESGPELEGTRHVHLLNGRRLRSLRRGEALTFGECWEDETDDLARHVYEKEGNQTRGPVRHMLLRAGR